MISGEKCVFAAEKSHVFTKCLNWCVYFYIQNQTMFILSRIDFLTYVHWRDSNLGPHRNAPNILNQIKPGFFE